MNVKPEDWAAQVLKVRVVCHTAGRVPNTKASDNHWSIFLIIGENRSVQYNMTAEAGYIDGNLKVTSYGYIESRSTLRYWDFEAISFFTISMVHNLPVTQRRFDQYDISGGGSGCRWWVYNVILVLASVGWIRPDAAASLWPHLLFKYSSLQDRTPLPMVQGTFTFSAAH
ncbi:hypothetical protein KCU85_g4399, partial [Aureobasidium melanogenum]